MFTGIIECIGVVADILHDRDNTDIWVQSPIAHELKIDQSVSHNGVCLTVVELIGGAHRVTAIAETLRKTNLGNLKVGDMLNIERCMPANGRFDGHIVQGHVDGVAQCVAVTEQGGSWLYRWSYVSPQNGGIVEKGSICVNGISLTCFEVSENEFSVAIIPYTYQHTNLSEVKVGDSVNLEYDIIGKYVAKLMGK